MSKKNQETVEAGQTVAAAVVEEPTYTVEEFAKAAKTVFGKETSPDIVMAALLKAGKDAYGVQEAKKLVEAFANKEVK